MRVPLFMRSPVTLNGICDVFSVRARAQMCRVAALGAVARVEDVIMPAESAAMGQFKCDTVGVSVGAAFSVAKPPILTCGRASERPAFGRRPALHQSPKWFSVFHPAILLLLLAGCTGISGPVVDCAAWRPITIEADDMLTRETARQVLAHNLTGRRLCGW